MPHDPHDPDFLTGPERAAARAQAKPMVKEAKAHGGCWGCLNRDRDTEGWGRALCGLKPPARFQSKQCVFKPDYERLTSDAHESRDRPGR